MEKPKRNEQYPDTTQQGKQGSGPNEKASREDRGDEGQGAPGVQGQYAGSNDQVPADPDRTAPQRPDPDTMNQNGSMHVALGKRKRDEKK